MYRDTGLRNLSAAEQAVTRTLDAAELFYREQDGGKNS
jgi:hypothetical protein